MRETFDGFIFIFHFFHKFRGTNLYYSNTPPCSFNSNLDIIILPCCKQKDLNEMYMLTPKHFSLHLLFSHHCLILLFSLSSLCFFFIYDMLLFFYVLQFCIFVPSVFHCVCTRHLAVAVAQLCMFWCRWTNGEESKWCQQNVGWNKNSYPFSIICRT